jgi:hypothetical protein
MRSIASSPGSFPNVKMNDTEIRPKIWCFSIPRHPIHKNAKKTGHPSNGPPLYHFPKTNGTEICHKISYFSVHSAANTKKYREKQDAIMKNRAPPYVFCNRSSRILSHKQQTTIFYSHPMKKEATFYMKATFRLHFRAQLAERMRTVYGFLYRL